MLLQLLTLTRNTFIESIRQPVYAVLLIAGTLGLWLNLQLAGYTMEDDNKMLIDLGLSMLFIVGLLLAGFTATGVVTAEIESRTVLTVVSKPVPRPLFIVGKYLGVASALALACWTLALVYLMTVRFRVLQTASDPIDWPVFTFAALAFLAAALLSAWGNYFFHWVFTSSFAFSYAAFNTAAYLVVLVIDKKWQFQSIATEFTTHEGRLVQVLIALLLLFEGILMLSAIAVAVSTRLGQVMTMVICVGVFLLGLISNSIYHQFANTTAGSSNVFARLLYWVMPNLQFLWQADALTAGHAIPMSHVALVTAYSTLYITALLCVAIALFQTREVG